MRCISVPHDCVCGDTAHQTISLVQTSSSQRLSVGSAICIVIARLKRPGRRQLIRLSLWVPWSAGAVATTQPLLLVGCLSSPGTE